MRSYTETFIRATVVDAWYAYTVPAGMRAVLRNITLATSGSTGGAGHVFVAGARVLTGSFTTAPGTFYYETRVVAYQGELVQALHNGSGGTLCVSGYLFVDDSGARGPGGGRMSRPAPLPGELGA